MVDTLFCFCHPLPAALLSSYFGWIMNRSGIMPAACRSLNNNLLREVHKNY